MENVLNDKVIRADNYITVVILIGYSILGIFYPLVFLLSIIIYPSFTLLIYGIIKIYADVRHKMISRNKKVLSVLGGTAGILFSSFLIAFFFSHPNVPSLHILFLFAFPIVIIGFAGIIKGVIINIYSKKHRILNIIIGIITLSFAIYTFLYAESEFLFYMIILLIMLVLNIFFRSALYLSEFGLTLNKIRNFKIVIQIINNNSLENEELANLLLTEFKRC